MRRVAIWLIALLLAGNGIAGIVAAVVGWRMTTSVLADLRQTSATIAAQQSVLVSSVNGVAVSVDDAAQATAGVSQSTARAREAVIQATQTSTNLAATFDRLSQSSQVTIFGMRPLEGLIQPFSANAEDFRSFGTSLTETAGSLEANARDMNRVATDLRGITGELRTAARQIQSTEVTSLLDQWLTTIEMGSRLLLMLIFFESLLSALLGLALFMLTGLRPAHPRDPVPAVHVEQPEAGELALDAPRVSSNGAESMPGGEHDHPSPVGAGHGTNVS